MRPGKSDDYVNDLPLVIVGGGSVGLFLAVCLAQKHIKCLVIEERDDPIQHSRALGIHPVSLELFDKLGIIDQFLAHGVIIKKGIANGDKSSLGEMPFSTLFPERKYTCPISCPQYLTEQILENEITRKSSGVLIRGAKYISHESKQRHVQISYQHQGELKSIDASFIVGCDGKDSKVRAEAGIPFEGEKYPDSYIMGDFEDHDSDTSEVVISLPRQGVVESFPLPNGLRRWVLKTDKYQKDPTREFFVGEVAERTGKDLSCAAHVMLNSFGIQHFLASTFWKDRVMLAGDSAHIVSPIGGQGMNLGWQDAWALAQAFSEAMDVSDEKQQKVFRQYALTQRKIAKKVARRAEWNMKMGRAYPFPRIRDLLVRTLLSKPFRKLSADLFTMQKLKTWWV